MNKKKQELTLKSSNTTFLVSALKNVPGDKTSPALCADAVSKKLDPYYITGFVDAEGSFGANLRKNSGYRVG
jgi:hypothetical protein